MKKNQFNSKKVAIIGAGIVGLYLAWKLSGQEYKVNIFEKKRRIGKEACSGLFSKKIIKFIPQSRQLIQNKIKYVLIHFPKKTVTVKFSQPFLLMNHAELDRLVAGLAKKAGAQIKLNCPKQNLKQIKKDFDRVIGCDGAYSAVRKELKLKEPYYRLGILGFVNKKDKSDYVETWAVPEGFIWRIPRGKRIEYGIMTPSAKARGLLQTFLKKNNIQLKNKTAAVIPQGLVVSKDEKVALCGDAAGMTKPWSGGGVVWGLIAVNILLHTFPDFLQYQKQIKRYFGLRIFFLKFLTQLVYFLGFKFPWLLPKNIKIEGDAIFPGFIE